jgi:hypothetical protein
MRFTHSTPRIYSVLREMVTLGLSSVSLAFVVGSAFAQQPVQIAADSKARLVAVTRVETSAQPAIELLEISQSSSGTVIHGLFRYSVPPPSGPPVCPDSHCHTGSMGPSPQPCGLNSKPIVQQQGCGPNMCPNYICTFINKPECCCTCSRTDTMCQGCGTDGYCQ